MAGFSEYKGKQNGRPMLWACRLFWVTVWVRAENQRRRICAAVNKE